MHAIRDGFGKYVSGSRRCGTAGDVVCVGWFSAIAGRGTAGAGWRIGCADGTGRGAGCDGWRMFPAAAAAISLRNCLSVKSFAKGIPCTISSCDHADAASCFKYAASPCGSSSSMSVPIIDKMRRRISSCAVTALHS